MSRPLLITDCDEVLLHMVSHFADWLKEAHGLRFNIEAPSFADALRGPDGTSLEPERVWPLLDGFFETEMHRQNIVPGALDALRRIEGHADIVILTNIGDAFQANRVEQLAAFEIGHRVLTNRGGKGKPVAELIEEMQPSVAVFVDDLAVHHGSVAEHAPAVWRLQMIAEPRMARNFPPAPHAHARIDAWGEAADWILARFADGVPAQTEQAA